MLLRLFGFVKVFRLFGWIVCSSLSLIMGGVICGDISVFGCMLLNLRVWIL